MTLLQIHESMWTVPSPLTVLKFIQLNTRMTIIRLENGGLWLHSPVPWSEELNKAVSALGEVHFVVAPSCFHHMFVGPWKEHHPNAKICAPKGLGKKRQDLAIDCILQDSTSLWNNEIEYIEIKGMPILQEHIFYHRPSHSMIVTDCLFYLPYSTGFTSFYAWLNGVKSTVGTSLLFKSAIKDKKAFQDSLVPLKNMHLDYLSLCHHLVLTNEEPEVAEQQIEKAYDRLDNIMLTALKKLGI